VVENENKNNKLMLGIKSEFFNGEKKKLYCDNSHEKMK